VLYAPWKMGACNDNTDKDEHCLLKRLRPAICTCEVSSFVLRTQTDPKYNEKKRMYECSSKPLARPVAATRIPHEWTPVDGFGIPSAGSPHVMEDLLSQLAFRNAIILTGGNSAHKELLMSFVCNMRALGIDHFMVVAFDTETYDYLFLRGAPVFYESIDDGLLNATTITSDGCVYGSLCHKSLAEMKIRIVSNLLKQGYSVLWSDGDIIWSKKQVTALMDKFESSSTTNVFMQKNDNEERINSKYYLVRSTPSSADWIKWMTDGVSSANLETEFLDSKHFPSGTTLKLWNKSSKPTSETSHGLEYWAPESDSCRWPWFVKSFES
jgi:hypothetical protein